MKWILLCVLAIVLWYIVAPMITPKPLRQKKGRTTKKQDTDVIEGKGRIID